MMREGHAAGHRGCYAYIRYVFARHKLGFIASGTPLRMSNRGFLLYTSICASGNLRLSQQLRLKIQYEIRVSMHRTPLRSLFLAPAQRERRI